MRFASCCRLFALVALAGLVFVEPALAASDPHAAEKGGGGMLDKLSFTGIKRYDLGIYTLIVFGLLMLVLRWKAWPLIQEGLEKREVNIRATLDEAKTALAEARKEREAAQAQLAEAAGQVRAMLDEARRDAEALRTAEREAGERDAQAARERARRELEVERGVLAKELHELTVQLATLMATKAIRKEFSMSGQQQLLEESIAELKANVNRA
jgi:F-type H+-transporting ATPase subunit b